MTEACCSEGKKGSRGQDERESQKAENNRRKEEEMDGVPPTTLGQDTSEGHCPLGGHGKFPGYRN